ncbi:MAG: TolC family protein [Methylophilus sp.]
MHRPWMPLLITLMLYDPSAYALDLLQAWHSAVANDKDYAVAQAGHGVVAPKQKQAQALWRPNVMASGTVGMGFQDTITEGAQFSTPAFGRSNNVNFNTSINGGLANRFALTANQPIYDPKRRAEQQQLLKSADLVELEWQASRQSLMLKVAQQYFDAAIAQKNLQVLQQQVSSIQKIAVEMRDRFNIGSSPVTDTHEAEARLAAMQAQQFSAELDLENKKNMLADTIGQSPDTIVALLPQAKLNQVSTLPLDVWINQAQSDNFNVRMNEIQVQLAEQEAKRHSFKSSIKLDAIAQYSRDELDGSGSYGAANSQQTNAIIGLQMAIPLSTGGYREAKQDEAVQLLTKANAEVELSRQQVVQQIRQTYLNVNIGKSRLSALEKSLKAGQLRLDATKLGRQVGDRTTLDVINAENEVATTQLNLVQAQADILMNRLQLSALAAELDERVLSEINQYLVLQQ